MLRRLLVPALTLAVSAGAFARPALDRPNVIVVFLDDAGYGDFSHTGNPAIRTPNLSRMVAEGMNCPQFYCASPACSASRYGILTGRMPGRSGFGSFVVNPNSARYLHPKEITLADGLRKRGYATAIFGKWHLGTPNSKNGYTPDALPLAHGFDRWVGTNVSADYEKGLDLIRSNPAGNTPAKGYEILKHDFVHDLPTQESLTARYFDAAEGFIRENKDRPFFIYLTPNQPHLPVHASKEFKGVSPRGEYGDAVEEIDARLGRLRAALREQGVENNTLVVFSSDNGPWVRFNHTKSHPIYGDARFKVGSAAPFLDGKGSDWEGGVRVPGVFCWPGVIPAGTVARDPVSTLDVLPTVFGLVGEPVPTDRPVDGRDIRPLFDAKRFPGTVAPFLYAYCGPDNRPVGVRSGPWKLLERAPSQLSDNHGYKVSPEHPVLFQLEQDFGEHIDLASEKPEEVAHLRERLAALKKSADSGSFWGAPEKPEPVKTEE